MTNPRLYILSANASGDIDGTVMQNILCQLPNRVTSVEAADAVIVPVSHFEKFTFNPLLRGIRKPVIVVDFMEYYSGNPWGVTHLFGSRHREAWLNCPGGAWDEFHEWCANTNLALTFKRELYLADESEKVAPIEWPCYLPAWEIEPKMNFDTRPFDLFFNWGMSNVLRPAFAAQTYQLMAKGKIDVIAHFECIDAKMHEPHRKWISVHSPHTHRTNINEVARRQAQSKMCLSLPGAGVKCFRSLEHLVHTAPVKLFDGMAWSYPWVHGENCIELVSSDNMAGSVYEHGNLDVLHGIYVAAQDLADRYRVHRYTAEYITPHIRRVL